MPEPLRSVDSSNAEHYVWGRGGEGWRLLDRREPAVLQEHVPSGGSDVPHLHHQAHQFFCVLAGEETAS